MTVFVVTVASFILAGVLTKNLWITIGIGAVVMAAAILILWKVYKKGIEDGRGKVSENEAAVIVNMAETMKFK